MKKRSLWKDIGREISHSKARFLSIFAIIMLGVGFFSGIKATAPDMLNTADAYYQDTQLMDLKVQSATGLTQDDLEALRQLPEASEAEPGYSADVFLGEEGTIARVHSYTAGHKLNQYRVVSGRLPEQSGEIVLDQILQEKHEFALGDKVTLSNPQGGPAFAGQFRTLDYTVVGFAASPLYIESANRGMSSIGKGTADGFAAIMEEDFQLPVFTEAYLQFADAAGHMAYSPEYEAAVERHGKAVEELLQSRSPSSRVFVLDRADNPGYLEYKSNTDRVDSLAVIFPVFFIMIAALVSLTTMSRMVEERRLQIGTLKALGYSNGEIMLKFLVYGTLASVAGTVAGLAMGFTLFPSVIYNAYSDLYNLPELQLGFYMSYSVICLLVALLCTTMTVFIATKVELRSNASVLMRPRTPKSGQRILLERIAFLWRRLSFVQKVTARNLFRYKQRMFMTVFGVAGCTALIFTGFSLKDSIAGIAGQQFGGIMKYNIAVAFHDNGDSEARTAYEHLLAEENAISGTMDVVQEAMVARSKGAGNQEVTVFVPSRPEKLGDFVALQDRKTGERKELTDQGAVITEKLSKLYDLAPGDTLTVANLDNETYSIKIAAITENYVMHYIYMTPAYYAEVFQVEPVYNTQLLNASTTDEAWEEDMGAKLIANEQVALVSFSSGVGVAFAETLKSMDVVIVVLVLSAAALAFVVLYNLTNINVSERIRELCTIKVLGFYDKEVTMYIYRENILLSLLGILAGSFLGIFLHRFVLATAELDATMFAPVAKWQSYAYSALLTLAFSAIVMVFMHLKLKRVDMIEALKAVE